VSTQSDPDWTAADERAVDLIRVLAMDAVQKAGSGYPGAAMSLTPTAYLLYQRLLTYEFGTIAERVAAAARDSLARVRA